MCVCLCPVAAHETGSYKEVTDTTTTLLLLPPFGNVWNMHRMRVCVVDDDELLLRGWRREGFVVRLEVDRNGSDQPDRVAPTSN